MKIAMLRVRSLFVAGTLAALFGACASTGTMNPDTRRPSRSADILSAREIADRASSATTALEAVRRLRVTWLRVVGVTSFRSGTPIRLYVNNTPRGNVDALTTIPVELVGEIRRYSASEATTRWGTGHTAGAIEVVLGRVVGGDVGPGPRPTNPAPEPSARRKDLPFTPRPIFFVHGGTSIFDKPTEKRKVWQPQVNIGGGVGINATRTVSVFAAIEYHSFSFSDSSTMQYLMASEFSPIRNSDGVELRGSGNHILSLSAYVKFHPRFGFIRPYLIGSAGYARFDSGRFTVSGPGGAPLPQPQFYLQSATGGGQVENTFTYGGGFGFDLKLSDPLRLFVDARYIEAIRGPRYNDVWDRNQLINTRFLPIRLGVTYK